MYRQLRRRSGSGIVIIREFGSFHQYWMPAELRANQMPAGSCDDDRAVVSEGYTVE